MYYTQPSPIAARLQVLTRRDQLKLKETIKEDKVDKKAANGKDGNEKTADGKGEDQKEKPKKRQPKQKAKAKGKAKATAMATGSGGDGAEKDERGPSEEVEFATPKKRLFADDEYKSPAQEPPIDPSPGKLPCIDPKTGKTTTVRELLNIYHPDLFEDEAESGGIIKEGNGEKVEEPGSKGKGKGKDKGKDKAKAKAKGKAQAKTKASPKQKAKKGDNKKTEITSPSIKKEKARRKKNDEKKQANAYQTESAEDMDDPVMRAVISEHVKTVKTYSVSTLKEYLFAALPNKFKSGAVVAYWTRATPSCGVSMHKDQSKPTSSKQHIGYFSFKIAKDWNTNMATAYVCAHLMAPWLVAGDGRV